MYRGSQETWSLVSFHITAVLWESQTQTTKLPLESGSPPEGGRMNVPLLGRSVTFLITVAMYLARNTLREFIRGHSLKVQATLVGEGTVLRTAGGSVAGV